MYCNINYVNTSPKITKYRGFTCLKKFSGGNTVFNHLLTCTLLCSDQGKFKRIPVFRDPKGGYGFAPPYEFDSLMTLVLYYATNTMDKHNPDLETVLRFPAFTSSIWQTNSAVELFFSPNQSHCLLYNIMLGQNL